MDQLNNSVLKQTLITYMDLEKVALNLTNYKGSRVLSNAIDSLKELLMQQGVISVDADCDGSITSVNSDFE